MNSFDTFSVRYYQRKQTCCWHTHIFNEEVVTIALKHTSRVKELVMQGHIFEDNFFHKEDSERKVVIMRLPIVFINVLYIL